MSLEPDRSKNGHRMNKSKPLKDISALDLAYIAGIIDGEGCISISKVDIANNPRYRTKVSYRGYLSVSNTNRALLEWMVATTGVGNLDRGHQHDPRNKVIWKWTVWTREAAALAALLQPHLKIKGPQALNLMAFFEAQRGPGGKNDDGKPKVVTPEELAFREEKYQRAREMNRRGPIAA